MSWLVLSHRSHSIRTIAVLTAAAGVLLGSTYVPVPGTTKKDLRVPFPCQDKVCGCRSADDCWASCCCHSDAEKLAWAEKHGISPPRWFTTGISAAAVSAAPAAESKCCQAVAETCCSARSVAPDTTAVCCRDEAEDPRDTRDCGQETERPNTLVCLKQHRKCQGHDGVFHLEWYYVVRTAQPVSTDRSRPQRPLQSVIAGSIEYPPPTPPPRAA